MTDNAIMAATATRALVAKVFPEFPFIYRPNNPSSPEAGGNIDFLDDELKVRATRPATAEEVTMLLAFETVREQLAALLLAKATDLTVAENRVYDYDTLLREALKWVPELAQVPHPDRLLRLRALIAGQQAEDFAGAEDRRAQARRLHGIMSGTVITVAGEESH